jgi:hypothetical protein
MNQESQQQEQNLDRITEATNLATPYSNSIGFNSSKSLKGLFKIED